MASADTTLPGEEHVQAAQMGPEPDLVTAAQVHTKARIIIGHIKSRLLDQGNMGQVSVQVDVSGDAGWAHHITVRKVVLSDPNVTHPGARAGWMDLTVYQAENFELLFTLNNKDYGTITATMCNTKKRPRNQVLNPEPENEVTMYCGNFVFWYDGEHQRYLRGSVESLSLYFPRKDNMHQKLFGNFGCVIAHVYCGYTRSCRWVVRLMPLLPHTHVASYRPFHLFLWQAVYAQNEAAKGTLKEKHIPFGTYLELKTVQLLLNNSRLSQGAVNRELELWNLNVPPQGHADEEADLTEEQVAEYLEWGNEVTNAQDALGVIYHEASHNNEILCNVIHKDFALIGDLFCMFNNHGGYHEGQLLPLVEAVDELEQQYPEEPFAYPGQSVVCWRAIPTAPPEVGPSNDRQVNDGPDLEAVPPEQYMEALMPGSETYANKKNTLSRCIERMFTAFNNVYKAGFANDKAYKDLADQWKGNAVGGLRFFDVLAGSEVAVPHYLAGTQNTEEDKPFNGKGKDMYPEFLAKLVLCGKYKSSIDGNKYDDTWKNKILAKFAACSKWVPEEKDTAPVVANKDAKNKKKTKKLPTMTAAPSREGRAVSKALQRKEQRRRRDLDNANRQEDGDGHPNAELMALKVVTTDQFQDFKKSMQQQIQAVKDMVPSAVFVNSSGPATENSAMNASVLRQMNQLTDTLRNLSDRVDRMEKDKYDKEVEQIKEAHAKHLQCLGAFMQILVAQLKNDSYTETLLQSYRQMFKIQESCGMQFLDSAFRKFVFGARGQAAESDD